MLSEVSKLLYSEMSCSANKREIIFLAAFIFNYKLSQSSLDETPLMGFIFINEKHEQEHHHLDGLDL